MKKISAIVRLFRPELPFAAGVCVVLGEMIALGRFPQPLDGFLGFACAFLISSSALILNDYFDLEVDRVNAPERSLPSGEVTPGEALWLTAVVTLLGLAAAAAINLPALILSIILWIIGFLYNWKFKEMGLLGNVMVSTSVGATFTLGGIVAGSPWNTLVWLFGLMAFLIDLGEEIAGDAMDMEGDRQRGSKSLAIRWGRQAALRVSASILMLVVLVSVIPIILKLTRLTYLIFMSITDAIIVVFTIRLIQSRTPAEGRSAMRVIYLGATFAVLAFIVGQGFS